MSLKTSYQWGPRPPVVRVRGVDIEPQKNFPLYLEGLHYLLSRYRAEKNILECALSHPEYLTKIEVKIKTENRVFILEDEIQAIIDYLEWKKISVPD